MKKHTKRGTLCLLAAMLSGCASQLPELAGTVKQMCTSVPPITTSQCDALTEQTALDIERDTAAKRVWCGPAPATVKQPPPANCPAKQITPPAKPAMTKAPLRGATS